jgi:hypothetical protein
MRNDGTVAGGEHNTIQHKTRQDNNSTPQHNQVKRSTTQL